LKNKLTSPSSSRKSLDKLEVPSVTPAVECNIMAFHELANMTEDSAAIAQALSRRLSFRPDKQELKLRNILRGICWCIYCKKRIVAIPLGAWIPKIKVLNKNKTN
jgi:hypothetical protein